MIAELLIAAWAGFAVGGVSVALFAEYSPRQIAKRQRR